MSWREDGSGNGSVAGNTVSHTGTAANTKANAIWSVGGTGYWEFSVEGGAGCWVGVAAETKFGPGYGMKGLFYGGPGNLSDGGSLVTGHWGPNFGPGDTIGMRLEQTADRVTVAFSKNGQGLGVAYDIQGWSGAAAEALHPAVSLSEPGQAVKIVSPGSSLPSLDSMLAGSSRPAGVLEGKWTGRCDLNVEKAGENSWRLGLKVGNSMSAVVTVGEGGALTVGPVISTKMMPPEHLQELEREMSGLLAGLKGLRREGDSLVLEGPEGKVERFQVGPGSAPATKENVNWIK